jgi:hypothetical protein
MIAHGAGMMQFTSLPSPASAASSMRVTPVESDATRHAIAEALPITGSAPMACPRTAVWENCVCRSGEHMLCCGMALPSG